MTVVKDQQSYHSQADPITVAGRKTMTEDPTAVSPMPTKDEARYRVAGSAENTCGGCQFGTFTAGRLAGSWGACQKVSGPIRAGYVCDHFQPEAASAAPLP